MAAADMAFGNAAGSPHGRLETIGVRQGSPAGESGAPRHEPILEGERRCDIQLHRRKFLTPLENRPDPSGGVESR
jgi:hypothetical protein